MRETAVRATEEPAPMPRGDVDDLIFGSEDPGPSQR